MTSFTPSRGDVALNKSAWVLCCIPSRPHRDLTFGHSEVPLFVSAQPVLMGFFPVSFQHWLMGTFSYTACFFTYCISSSRAFRTKTGSNHPPLASSQYFPSRIEFSSCRICPPSLLRLRFFSIWGVKSKGLTCVPLAMCIVEEVCPASPICCRRPSQISESRFSRRLVLSTRLAICGLFVREASLVLRLACLLRHQARGRHHACTPSVSCTEERAAMRRH